MKKIKVVFLVMTISLAAIWSPPALANRTLQQVEKEIKEAESILFDKSKPVNSPDVEDAKKKLGQLYLEKEKMQKEQTGGQNQAAGSSKSIKNRARTSNSNNSNNSSNPNTTNDSNEAGSYDNSDNSSDNSENSGNSNCREYGPLGIPKWFRGLVDTNCEVIKPEDRVGDNGEIVEDGLQRFVAILLLNIGDMLLRVIGLVATAFIIIGGFKYIFARGESGKVVAAKKTIVNAIIGLVIAMISMTIVNFVFNLFKR